MNTTPSDSGRSGAAAGHACPLCGGAVDRVRRRFIDRLLSQILPVYRYRCNMPGCHWEGNLRQERPSLLSGEPR
jgi:hypothetical protein